MQLDVLRTSLAAFGQNLRRGRVTGLEHLYETVTHWQAHWPPRSPEDLADALDACLANSRSRAHWQTRDYYPKQALTTLARFSPEMVNLAFGRLFDARQDLGERLAGFTFYLDEVLGEHARRHPTLALESHYHDDYRAPSLYVAARHPGECGYFEHEVYSRALGVLRARDVSPAPDLTRFAKTVKVVLTFAAKDEAVWSAHHRRLAPGDYAEPCGLFASEYFRFLAGG